MIDEIPEWNQVWLGAVDTPDNDGYYPIIGNVNTLATGTFSPKITFGDYTKDDEDYISTLIISDLSGGMNIEDMNEGSDATRCWVSFMDSKRSGKITLNPEVERFQWSGASGTAYPLGAIGDVPYGIIGNEIAGLNTSTDTHYTEEAFSLNPVGKAITFAGKIFVPCGASGYAIVTESAPGNPTVTNVTSVQAHPSTFVDDTPNTDAPAPVAFTVFDQRIWALTTSGAMAWSFTGNDNEWTWPYDGARGWYPRLQTGYTPKRIEPFYGPQGTPRIAISSDRGIFLYDWDKKAVNDTAAKFPPHPDFGAAMTVWRAGEDLHIALGMDVWKLTAANVIVPLSTGLARDDGMPPELWGRIVDIEPEMSELFYLVGPVQSGASGFSYADQVGGAGSSDGQFTSARGIDVDQNGDVWVADGGHPRIQRFSGALDFEAKSGSSGSGNGQFAASNGAWDIASDGTNLHVVDRGNHRVQKFNVSGVYQSQIDGRFTGWTSNAYGSLGGGISPNFNGPCQVAVDSSGNVFVADANNNRIVKISNGGAYISQIAGIVNATGVAVDGSGNVYRNYNNTLISDYFLTKLDPGGAILWSRQFSRQPKHIALDGTHVYMTTIGSPNVTKLRMSDGVIVATWGSAGSGAGQFQYANGIATDGTHVYVSDFTLDRITKFTTAGVYVTHWGTSGAGNSNLDGPQGIAVDSGGDVWVAEHSNNRIHRFTNVGVHVETYAITTPNGLAFDANGALWVSSLTGHTVTRLFKSVNGAGFGDGQFNLPEGVAVNVATGRIYVADTGNNRVQHFDAAGAFTGKWGVQGVGDGAFNSPVDIAVRQDSGDVFVLDRGNARVQQFDANGGFIRAFGTVGPGDGQFQSPTAIAVRPNGQIFVADDARDDVQIFSPLGAYVAKVGTGSGGLMVNGEFSEATGLAFSADGNTLYVSDKGAARVQAFTFSVNASGTTVPYLAAWTGVGLYGKWRGSVPGVTPTHAMVIATSTRYDLWWGMDDGYLYRMPLRRYFHNPRQGLIAGEDRFQPSEEIITAKFDAAMLGFWKIASHVVVFLEQASADEYVTIEYRTDADGSWTLLGTANSNDRTYLPFGVDPVTLFSSGVAFNWIQFRIRAHRGEDPFKAPLIKSIVFAFLKIPQNANAFNFVVAFPNGDSEYQGRDAATIRKDLFSLVDSRRMVKLRLHEWADDDREFRGYLTSVSGDDAPSPLAQGTRAVNFIEVRDHKD